MPQDNIQNWYDKIPKKLLPKYHNPNYKEHLLNLPFRLLLCGGSGARKTTTLMEIIHRCKDTFELIILCVKTADEPLYRFLQSKVPSDQLHIYENGKIPPLEEYKSFKGQVLMVFDDLVNETKAQPFIQEWFLRGRKLCGGVSMCYLTQSYFKTPKFVRINCNYILLKKLSSVRDLNLILGDYNLGVSPQELTELYKYATSNHGTLFIDIDAAPENRFRRNLKEIIRVDTSGSDTE